MLVPAAPIRSVVLAVRRTREPSSSSPVTVAVRPAGTVPAWTVADDLDLALRAEHVLRAREDVGQVDLRHDVEPHVPVDAGRLQVVHRRRAAALGVRRDVEPAPVHDHREHVVAMAEVAGEFGREGQVAALVAGYGGAVEHDGGVGHHPVEGHEHPAARDGRAVEVLAVDPDALPGGVVPVGPGQPRDGMRHRDAGEPAVVMPGLLRPLDVRPAEQPALAEVVTPRPQRGSRRPRALPRPCLLPRPRRRPRRAPRARPRPPRPPRRGARTCAEPTISTRT